MSAIEVCFSLVIMMAISSPRGVGGQANFTLHAHLQTIIHAGINVNRRPNAVNSLKNCWVIAE